MQATLANFAVLVDGQLCGDGSLVIEGLRSAERCCPRPDHAGRRCR